MKTLATRCDQGCSCGSDTLYNCCSSGFVLQTVFYESLFLVSEYNVYKIDDLASLPLKAIVSMQRFKWELLMTPGQQ